MYKKCENCYKDGKVPDEESCKNCEDELKAKAQELQQAMDNYVQLDLQRVKEYNELVDLYKAKEQECEELKKEQAEIKKYLGISHKTILERLEELTDFRDRDREELDQLKQTLTEIKEIAEEYEELHGFLDCSGDLILQKNQRGNK